MQLKEHFVVAHPREVVWDFFGRMEEVTPCMPGASLPEPPQGNHAKFKLSVKLGPINAAFVGDAELERDAENYKGVIRGAARDSRGDSRVKGVVDYALSPQNDGLATAVDIDVDFALTGRLAQFSRGGVVNDLAARLTEQFANNLETALGASTPPPAPVCDEARAATSAAAPSATPAAAPDASAAAPRVPAASTPPRPRVAATELNAGSLIVAVLWGRIKAFLRSIFRRQ